MHLSHIAIWTSDLERSKHFYETWFGGRANTKYHNQQTGFTSYFLSFSTGARLEIMQRPDITSLNSSDGEQLGLAHMAFSVGNADDVDTLTERFRAAGVVIASEPRTTGDGYYESVVLDPDGNRVEITT
ncbi:VOC family protein [Desulfovibrio inopinatus]|uniref:VOC family protein n=1 Tax=Desulfovibrio inopinatus TaxID=102109 RepID=UPI000426315A|nr:VOC family protein [Desulfovibrio inopinatus]